MPSAEALTVIAELRAEPPKPERDPPRDRADWLARALADPPLPGTRIELQTWGGVAAEMVTGPGVSEGAGQGGLILLWHGGGYVAGCPTTHRKMASQISVASGLPVLVPDYRLAPEAPAPAAVEDALAVWRALLDAGYSAGRIGLAGDSAGGGLAIAHCLAARDAGLPLPAAAWLMSPWTDILARGDSYRSKLAEDPSMIPERLRGAGVLYVGDGHPDDPLISPIGADLSGLPPMLVHVGGAEVMLDDSTVFAERLRDQGGAVECKVWDGLWHVFQNSAPRVPEAVAAMNEGAAFLRAHIR